MKLPGHNPSSYRCDVCGRKGFWRSDGFAWMRYGPIEGDGVDTCSEGCRESMGDPEKAFLRLFKLIKDDFNSRDAVRRHDGLFSDKAPKPEPDDDFPYTTSMTETIPCPRCDEPVSIDSSVCASCKSDLVIKSETVTTNYCSLANRK